MTDSSRVTAIRERTEAATRGPWRIEKDRLHEPMILVNGPGFAADALHRGVYECDDPEDGCIELTDQAISDAEFIAHARDDIPYLLGLIDAVRALHPKTPTTGDKGICRPCNAPWPCPTISALGVEG